MIIITVHDEVGDTWSNPVVAQNEAAAVRDFDTACSDKRSLLGQHSTDFKLYAIAEWTPSIEPGSLPVFKSFREFKFLKQGSANDQS